MGHAIPTSQQSFNPLHTPGLPLAYTTRRRQAMPRLSASWLMIDGANAIDGADD
jgi:hypothetical protein